MIWLFVWSPRTQRTATELESLSVLSCVSGRGLRNGIYESWWARSCNACWVTRPALCLWRARPVSRSQSSRRHPTMHWCFYGPRTGHLLSERGLRNASTAWRQDLLLLQPQTCLPSSRQSALGNSTNRILARLEYHHQRITALKLLCIWQSRQLNCPFLVIAASYEFHTLVIINVASGN